MPRPRPSRRPSVVLLVVLLAALGTGAAASALAGAATSPTPSGASPVNVELTGDVVMYAFTGIVILGAAILLYRRIAGGATPIPGEFAVVALVCILLLILFVIGFRSLAGGGSVPTNTTASGSSGNATHQPNSTGPNGTANGTGSYGGYWFNPPPWILFVAVAGIAAAVAAVAVPELRALAAARRLARDEEDADREAADRARAALAGAADALGEGRDPREVIIALYAELLERLSPMVGDLAPETPEEIRAHHLVRLGIAPARAEALTRLFEEARYSTHPLGPEEATRARDVIRAAEYDLARLEVPP